jgi:hypothetical protein
MARVVVLLVVLFSVSCANHAEIETFAVPDIAAPRTGGLQSFRQLALPSSGVQPWETVDSRGFVIPQQGRSTSAFAPDSYFVPGVERFSEVGNVTDKDETSVVVAGSNSISGGIYRFPMGGVQPGAWAVDVNLHEADGKLSRYWVGTSNYGRRGWDWHGPYSDSQVTKVVVAGSNNLSGSGTFFIAVVADGEALFDIVGVSVSPLDDTDTTPPPTPAAPSVTAISGGLELSWADVIAADLAGYQIYWSYSPFDDPSDNGVNKVALLENTTRTVLPVQWTRDVYVALSAVDVNGNESTLSTVVRERRLSPSSEISTRLSIPKASAQRNDSVTLTATGADLYDFDLDGDGTFDVTGSASGTASVDTSNTGIIRPRVRGTNGDSKAVAFGSVSLIVSGNQRPVANAQCTPQQGMAPLSVAMNGTGEDFDGSIAEYAWDFDGDGIYDHDSPADGITAENYTQPGLYNAKLRVTDDQGAWDVDTVAVQVLKSDLHLEALPNYAAPGQRIDLMVHADAPVVKYEWDLNGDGIYERETGSTAETVVSYPLSGPQTPAVRATLENGAQTTTLVCVLISGFAQQHGLEGGAQSLPRAALAIIANKPAIAYAKGSPLNLYFKRATTPDGSSWGNEVVVDTTNGAGNRLKLLEAGGVPVIAYENNITGDLVFARGANAAGSSWHLPQILDLTFSAVEPSLAIVSGNPAISYCDTGDLKYVRALDASGASWDIPITLDAADFTGLASCLAVISGQPAVSYVNDTISNLRYIRATDATGAAWGGPQSVSSASSLPTQLMEAGSAPIICYQSDAQPYSLRLSRGIYPDGGSWFDGVVLYSSVADTGYHIALGKVNGLPVLAFGGLTGSFLLSATDQNGTSWGPPEQFSVDLASFNSVTEIDGKSVLAYCTSDKKLSFATKH